MITFEHVTVQFDDAVILQDVQLTVPEGSLTLVAGRTGSGKSTLLRAINGLVPHFTGGTVAGRVVVDGRDTAHHRPRDLAEVVGFVDQNPLASFVTETVEDEIAYAMESLGVAPDQMRRRVEETLDLLGIAPLRRRALRTLSGGEQQRVAIASVIAAGPRIVVLDEPTSALDPVAAEEVLATLSRLVHDLALTVVLAEHRLERVIHYADQLVIVTAGRVQSGEPALLMQSAPVAPPVVELGRALGLTPLPLSVRQARRGTMELRAQLSTLAPEPSVAHRPTRFPRAFSKWQGRRAAAPASSIRLEHVGLVRDGRPVLQDLSLQVVPGELVALMGRNGSGKTTALSSLAGLLTPTSGEVATDRRVGMVPQDPSLILYADSVAAECAIADRDAQVPAGTTLALWRRLLPSAIPVERHPRDLSEGQRLALALAIILAAGPEVLLLDEPTRGLDYASKTLLVQWLREFTHQPGADGQPRAVLVATHDVELVAEVCTRVVVLGEGSVVSDRPVREALYGSLAFAPQVAKVMYPVPVLTVAEALDLAQSIDRPTAPDDLRLRAAPHG